MFRKDTKTEELKRQQQSLQSSPSSNHNNDENIFSCCFNTTQHTKQKSPQQQQQRNGTALPSSSSVVPPRTSSSTQQALQPAVPPQIHTVNIAAIPDTANGAQEEDEVEEEEEERSLDDRLVRLSAIPSNANSTTSRGAPSLNHHDLNLTVVDTTNAFLELLQLDSMSQHLQEMRDRRLFLEKAKNDTDLPEEEREIAAWITADFLCKSPTQNISAQTLLQNIIKKQEEETSTEQKTTEQQQKAIDDKQIKELSESDIELIVKHINAPLSENARVIALLSSINEWNFSVFEFVEVCGNFSLSLLMCSICKTREMLGSLNVPMPALVAYMNLVDVNYKDNPYHNDIHAADVLLNMYYFMKSGIFLHNVSVLDCFAILIASSVHDIGHPGHGNPFEINTESELAILYNDQSVLENMHICLSWRLLQEQGANFLVHFDKSQKKRFRKILIDSILATDMSQHGVHSETLESLVEQYPQLLKDNVEKFSNQFLPIALHTADLGNLCKSIEYYTLWVDRLMEEFFNQGDKERGLGIEPISFLCDRFKVNIHHGQVGFINFVIRPWFTKFGKLLAEDSHNKLFLDHLNDNLNYMQERANQTKDAQEEIQKNQHIIDEHHHHNNNNNDHDNNGDGDGGSEDVDELIDTDEEELADTVKNLPNIKPKVYPIADDDGTSPGIGTRSSSSKYSIVGMSLPEMKSKLLEYADKEKGIETTL